MRKSILTIVIIGIFLGGLTLFIRYHTVSVHFVLPQKMTAIEAVYGSGTFTPEDLIKVSRITSYNVCYTKLLRSWLIDGSTPIDDVMRVLNIEAFPEHENYETIAGFMMFMLRKIPKRTDAVSYEGYKFEVVDIDSYKIDQLLVSRISTTDKSILPNVITSYSIHYTKLYENQVFRKLQVMVDSQSVDNG